MPFKKAKKQLYKLHALLSIKYNPRKLCRLEPIENAKDTFFTYNSGCHKLFNTRFCFNVQTETYDFHITTPEQFKHNYKFSLKQSAKFSENLKLIFRYYDYMTFNDVLSLTKPDGLTIIKDKIDN